MAPPPKFKHTKSVFGKQKRTAVRTLFTDYKKSTKKTNLPSSICQPFGYDPRHYYEPEERQYQLAIKKSPVKKKQKPENNLKKVSFAKRIAVDLTDVFARTKQEKDNFPKKYFHFFTKKD